jgi:hypothetical protein
MRGVTVHFSLQPLRSLQAHRGAGQKLDQAREPSEREHSSIQHDAARVLLAQPALCPTGATTARAVRRLLERTLDGQPDDIERDDIEREG